MVIGSLPPTYLPGKYYCLHSRMEQVRNSTAVYMVVDCIAVYYAYFTYDTAEHKYM